MGWETVYALSLNKPIENFDSDLFYSYNNVLIQDVSYIKSGNRKEWWELKSYGKGLKNFDSISINIKYGTDEIIDVAKQICKEYNISVIVSITSKGNCSEFDYSKLNGKIIH